MKGQIVEVSTDEYHAGTFCENPCYSNSIGKILMTRSPYHAMLAHPKLNPDYRAYDDKKYDLGTAAHAALLEGLDVITVVDAPDWRTNAAKEARDAAYAKGKTPLLQKGYDQVQAMVKVAHEAIANCSDFGGLTLKDGSPEVALLFEENGVLCKARADWISNDMSLIIDLKTTEISGPAAWMRAIGANMYDMQNYLYKRAIFKITGRMPRMVFAVQETTFPYCMYFVELSQAWEAIGEQRNNKALSIWKNCLEDKSWPAYPMMVMQAQPPSYMLAEAEEIANEINMEALDV